MQSVRLSNLPEPILYESHMHTPFCGHARGEVDEYAAVAMKRNLKGIIVTCHNPLPAGLDQTVRMPAKRFPQYVAYVQSAQTRWAGRIDIRLGLECDFLPGLEAFLAEQTRSAEFDFLLGSVHPHMDGYKRAYGRGGALAFQRMYFEHIAAAAESGLFDCLAHPDLVKQVTQREWKVDRILPDVCRALDRIAKTGVAMEMNTSAYENGYDELSPSPRMLREMAKRWIPVVVGSDAHRPERVADRWLEVYGMLEEAGYRCVSHFTQRKRTDISITEARRSLAPAAHRAA